MVASISGNAQMHAVEHFRMMMDLKNASTDGVKGLSKDELGALNESLKQEGKESTPFVDKLLENFDKVDKNSDGQLTRGEVASSIGKSKGQGQAKKAGMAPSPAEESTSEEVVMVAQGEDNSPVTTDENGNIVFRTVIKLDSGNTNPAFNPVIDWMQQNGFHQATFLSAQQYAAGSYSTDEQLNNSEVVA